MTLIAGVRCTDGFVISADSESTRGDIKTHGEKISEAKGAPYELVIAGCGHEDYIDDVKDQVFRGVRALSAPNVESVRDVLKREIVLLHTEAIFKQWDRNDPGRPEAHLIVGFVSEDGHHAIWKTCDLAVSQIKYYQLMGTGDVAGNRVAGRLLTQNLPTAIVHHLLTQIVMEGKRGINVGGDIHTVSVRWTLGSMDFYHSGLHGKSYLWSLENHLLAAIRSALEKNAPRMDEHRRRLNEGLGNLLGRAQNGPPLRRKKFDARYPVNNESDALKDVTESPV